MEHDVIIGALVGIGLKFVADIGVRLSKRTENHIDDLIATSFKNAVSGFGIFNFFKKK